MSGMKRREFILALGGAVASPLAAGAEQSERVRTIGILASQSLAPIQRFARKLRDHGYVEGQNLRLVSRFAEDRDERYPVMAAELTAIPVDLIVTWGTPAALAAKQATTTIPIVMGAIGDPGVGIVSNLARPEGNITGFAAQNVDLDGKRLELLKDLLPHLSRVGILANSANPVLKASLQKLRPAAETLRVAVEMFDIQGNGGLGAALLHLTQTHPDAVLVAPDLLLLTQRKEIAAALVKSKLPAVSPVPRIHGRRRSHDPRRESRCSVRARGRLRRQDPQGRQAGRSAGAAGNRMRADHKSEERLHHRLDESPRANRPHRRGDS